MKNQYLKNRGYLPLLLSFTLTSPQLLAAEKINLRLHPQKLVPLSSTFITTDNNFKVVNQDFDFNGMRHVRIKQYYRGYPVWGADGVLHVVSSKSFPSFKKGQLLQDILLQNTTSMNGMVYGQLEDDLSQSIPTLDVDHIRQEVERLSRGEHLLPASSMKDFKTETIVYVDHDHKAHWAYLASIYLSEPSHLPKIPTFILDAETLTPYMHWDNLKTNDKLVQAGGLGGNEKKYFGDVIYDYSHEQTLTITRQSSSNEHLCLLKNPDVIVTDVRNDDRTVVFPCTNSSSHRLGHEGLYWNEEYFNQADAINGAFSPSNDALYMGSMVGKMYRSWYGIPVLLNTNNTSMVLKMRVHEDMENAYWDGYAMTFGDGGAKFYPLVSLGVVAHEISHGFTEQHSNLIYSGQAGGLNESFSDMAAKAAEHYAGLPTVWQIGPEIMKAPNKALRYMDLPSTDCWGREPGHSCSIDDVSQYSSGMNVHNSSGVFNRFFYLMANQSNWNIKKIFNVMVKANRDYWTPTTTFQEAACGVLAAGHDYRYPILDLVKSLKEVGFTDDKQGSKYDISQCIPV